MGIVVLEWIYSGVLYLTIWGIVYPHYYQYYGCRSKELRDLIGRLEHQSPHLLDTMEQVISYLHADWQQLKKDCDNLQRKLRRWVCPYTGVCLMGP